MKKLSKCVVLVALATIVVGISQLFQPTNKINKDIKTQIAKAYNHSTENALDNVFMRDSKLILPFIFDNINQASTLDIRTKFAKAGVTIKNISTNNVGTGTQITVNESTNIYNILIYGDVNGDGQINLIDAQRIILHYLNPTANALTGLNAMAANVNNKDNEDINLIDAQRVILFYLGNLNAGLVVEEPISTGNPENPENPDQPVNPDQPERDYITGITITSPDKHIYNYGEELDLTGGKVHVVYVSGNIRTINMINSMISGYDKNKSGVQTVIVTCKTQNTVDNSLATFIKTFTVTVREQSGGDEPVIPKPPTTKDYTGYRFEELSILENVNEDIITAIKKVSNGNETALELKDNGEYYLEDKKIVKVTSENGTIKFIAYEEGKYEIEIGEAKPITVLISEDKSVNSITIETSNDEVTIKQGIPTKMQIKFWHEYKVDNNIVDKKEIKLDISRVSILIPEQLKDLVELKILNNNDSDLSTKLGDDESKIVDKILITSKQSEKITLPITVTNTINNEDKTYTENIEIAVEKMELIINDGNSKVTLYREVPEGNTLVKEVTDKYGEKLIYTLIPIYKIDENGKESIEIEGQVKNISRVVVSDIAQLNVEGDISFGGTTDDTIILEAFRQDKEIIEDTQSKASVYYIGIATLDGGTDKANNIEVTYAGQNITTLEITIVGDIVTTE